MYRSLRHYVGLTTLSCFFLGQSAVADIPAVELLRTDQELTTSVGVPVGKRIVSSQLTDSDGMVLSGELFVTFELHAEASNTYNINGQSVTPGQTVEFTHDFSGSNGKLDIPAYVEGLGAVSEDDYTVKIQVPGLVLWQATLKGTPEESWSWRNAWFDSDGNVHGLIIGRDEETWTSSDFALISMDQEGNTTQAARLEFSNMQYIDYLGEESNGDFVFTYKRYSTEATYVIAPDGTERYEMRDPTYAIHPTNKRLLTKGSKGLSMMNDDGSPGPVASYFPSQIDLYGSYSFSNGTWGMVVNEGSGWNNTSPTWVSYTNQDGIVRKWFKEVDEIYYNAKHPDIMWTGPLDHYLTKDGTLRHYRFTGYNHKWFERDALADTDSEIFRGLDNPWGALPAGSLVRLAKDGSYAKASKRYICTSPSFSDYSIYGDRMVVLCGNVLKMIDLSAENKFTDISVFEGMDIVTPDEETIREPAQWEATVWSKSAQDNLIGTSPAPATTMVTRP